MKPLFELKSKNQFINKTYVSIKIFPLVKLNETLQLYYSAWVSVAVSHHFFRLLKSQLLMKFLSACQQVFGCNKAFIVLVDVLENTLNVFSSVILVWLLSHQFYELLEINFTSIISIKYCHRNVDKSSTWLVAAFSKVFSEIKWSQHTVMIFIKEVEELLVDLNIPDRALGNDEFSGIEVYIFPGSGEAASRFTFSFSTLLYTLADPKAFSVSSPEFVKWPAH